MAIRRMASGPVGGGCATVVLLAIIVGFLYVSGIGPTLLGQLQAAASSPTSVTDARPSGTPVPGTGSLTSATPQAPQGTPLPATATPPAPDNVAREYLAAWQDKRWTDMYGLLAPSAQATIDQTKFVTRYQNITDAATVTQITTTMGQPQLGPLPNIARVPFQVSLSTIRLGTITEQNTLPLSYENGHWGVRWTPSLIFKDLQGDNLVQMVPLNPQRGSILDRQGRPLATQGFILEVGVVPGEIKNETDVLNALTSVTGMQAADIKKLYTGAQPDWFIPIKDMPAGTDEQALHAKLDPIPGVMIQSKSVRQYPNGELAENIVGYVTDVTAEDLQKLAGKGYDASDVIGRAGIEAWAEDDLAGTRGGRLLIVSPSGEVLRVIAEQPAKRGNDVYLTIDIDIQRKAEEALGTDKPGSIVVMDPSDNSILALATYPRVDPNMFAAGISSADWQKIVNDPRFPMMDRPAMGAYPTGSIFKLIPYTAAIEKLGYNPYQMTPCPGSWTIPNSTMVLHDLLPQGHGTLPFPQTLTQSCNVPFYQIGYKLNQVDPNLLPNWARLYGIGQAPGTIGLVETAGTLPDPQWKQQTIGQPWVPGDAVELAIGQGFLQASPLQMANAYSTLANRGLLRTPLLVRKITSVDGKIVRAFTAQEKDQVPLQDTTLQSIYDGLSRTGFDPHGTAYYAFSNYRKTSLMAKTGSAQNNTPGPHAWFAGWAPAQSPQYLIIVMIEGGNAGGTVAAPKARKLMDYLFPTPLPASDGGWTPLPQAQQPAQATPTPAPRPVVRPAPTKTPTRVPTKTPTRVPTKTPAPTAH